MDARVADGAGSWIRNTPEHEMRHRSGGNPTLNPLNNTQSHSLITSKQKRVTYTNTLFPLQGKFDMGGDGQEGYGEYTPTDVWEEPSMEDRISVRGMAMQGGTQDQRVNDGDRRWSSHSAWPQARHEEYF